MDWHILLTLPLLGLTANYRGVKVGGKYLGMGPKQLAAADPSGRSAREFDKAKAAGDREGMTTIAKQMEDAKVKRTKISEEAKGDVGAAIKPMERDFEALTGNKLPRADTKTIEGMERTSLALGSELDTRVFDDLVNSNPSRFRENEYFRRLHNKTVEAGNIIREMRELDRYDAQQRLSDLRTVAQDIRKTRTRMQAAESNLRNLSDSDVRTAAAYASRGGPDFNYNPRMTQNPRAFYDRAANIYAKAMPIFESYAQNIERIGRETARSRPVELPRTRSTDTQLEASFTRASRSPRATSTDSELLSDLTNL